MEVGICSRYGSAAEFNLLEKTYRVKWPDGLNFPNGTIYPHKPAPVIVQIQKAIAPRLMNFSLIPSWSKEKKPKFTTYNARIEEVLKKPSWREPFKSKHCLVPIQYFIESVYEGPYAGHNISIADSNHQLMTAAGIWDTWINKTTGEVIDSFAILTCEPPKSIIEAGHDRCPIFLKESAWLDWLNCPDSISDLKNPKQAQDAVEMLLENRAKIDFSFEEKEALKSFRGQLSFGDE